MTHAAWLHRRRFHRRDRSRQHAGARGHAHDPGDRRAFGPARRGGGRGRRGAQVAHHRPGRGGRPVPCRARLAEARRVPAVLFQVLLDLQLHAQGQHRPRHGCADGRVGGGLHDCLPGVSRGRPHHLPRLPVRGRRAAVGIGHEGPSAHPHDGRQPRARAAAADEAQGWPAALRRAGARRPAGARGDRGAAAAGRGDCRCRCAGPGRSRLPRRGVRGAAAGDGGLRGGACHCRASPPGRPSAPCGGGGAAAQGCWPGGGAVGELLASHQRAGRGLDQVAARLPCRSSEARGRPAGGGGGAGLGAGTPAERGPC